MASDAHVDMRMRSGPAVRAAVIRVAAARAGWALACALAPRAVGGGMGIDPADRRGTRTLRMLGLRELAQSGATVAAPRPEVIGAGIAVDGLHALSMVALAAVSPGYRRPALSSAAVTAAWALASYRAARPT